MTEIELTDSALVVHVQGIDRIFAFKSRLEVPLSHVVGAEVDPNVVQQFNDWKSVLLPRIAGVTLPGVMRAGKYYVDHGWVFWDVQDPQQAITIKLADESYSRLVIEVADPAAAVATIEEAIRAHRASSMQ